MVEDIKDKIRVINTNDLDLDVKKKIDLLPTPSFTNDELTLIEYADAYDISKGKIKDHFPYNMSNLKIMKSIKEAYENAVKISGRIKQESDNEEDGTLAAPLEGKQIYEGTSKDGLVIQFYYNYDLNIVETAYPARKNNNANMNIWRQT